MWHTSIKCCLGLNLPGFVFLGLLQKSSIPGRERRCHNAAAYFRNSFVYSPCIWWFQKGFFFFATWWMNNGHVYMPWMSKEQIDLSNWDALYLTLSEQWNCSSFLLFEGIFLVGDWKPSSSGNVMKSQRASWVLVQVSDSYILVSNAQCTVQWELFLIPRQGTHSTLSCSSIAEGTSLLRKETKPLQAFPPQRSTADSFVFKTVFPRFHQLLKTTCRSLEDWVAHFTQVKWQDSESVLLCEIRRHASIGTVVARLWKKNTAVSFLNWLLGNKLKLVQFMVCLWHHHFMRNSSQRDSWHAHLLALWNRSLLSGCLSLLCQIEATRSAHCPGARSSHCRPHQFGSHKVFFENVA